MKADIERLAKAAITADGFVVPSTWSDAQRESWLASYESSVRAILQALREPSEATLVAGLGGWREAIKRRDAEGTPLACWQAMIDHLLSEDA